jgi:PIN domain nuclease of toxin-antitoxin system
VKSYVLDTHACIFALAAPDKLGRGAVMALRAVEAGRATAWIPAAVLAEVALLHERDRVGIGVADVRAAMASTQGLRFLPLDLRQIEEFAAHRQVPELFDRWILAAGRATHAQLVTMDSVLAESGLIPTIWD